MAVHWLAAAAREVEMLESESASDGFWNNLEKAQKVQQRGDTVAAPVQQAHDLPGEHVEAEVLKLHHALLDAYFQPP